MAATAVNTGPPRDIEERFRRLESLVARQADQIRRLSEENRNLAARIQAGQVRVTDARVRPAQAGATTSPAPPEPFLPGIPPDEAVATPPGAESTAPPESGFAAGGADDAASEFSALLGAGNEAFPTELPEGRARSYLTGFYDEGFVVVAPHDKQRTPFALKVNLVSQLRYTGFTRSVETWKDSSGLTLPVYNRSYFSLNRNFFSFSGFAFSPRLQYNAMIFSTSTLNLTVVMGEVNYEFSRALTLSSGYFKVPGTREWLESFRYTMGADRTLANTFFRPSISPGVWIEGEPLDGLFYYAGIFNTFDSLVGGANRISDNMAYSGNIWWEPLGEFGPGFTDEEYHDRLAIRAGSSLTYQRAQREPNLQLGQTNPENTVLRLSDGTPIFQPGALAPGVTLLEANALLLSYDLAFKYRGFSLSAEYYGRWFYGLNARGGMIPGDRLNMFDTGGFAQLSYAVIPKRFELFARTSGIFGPFGDGSEYGGGVNWYAFSNRNVRATFEAKRINHSPADNILYGYFAGESGMLYQLQLLTDF